MNVFITFDAQIIGVVSIAMITMSMLVRRAVLDMDKLKESKEKLKGHQNELKEATKSGDTKKAQKAQGELMKLMMENMKLSFKPMMFTMIPFIIVFGWLRNNYGDIGSVVNLFGYEFGWFGWYLICSMSTSIILNKIFKMY